MQGSIHSFELRGRTVRNLWLSLRLFVGNHVVSHFPVHAVRLRYYRSIMGAVIGPGSSIHLGAYIDSLSGLTVGTNSTINQGCRLDSRGGITIGNNVSISADVRILTADHDLQSRNFVGTTKPVAIEDYVFVGTGATILPGVRLGRGSAVGAGSVVTKHVAPRMIVAGVPARIIGERRADLDYNPSYRRPLF